jgi:hypothetical protein
MDVIGFLCVSQGSRRACAYSGAGFSSKKWDPAWGVYYRRAALCCTFFSGQEDSMQRIFIKKYFLRTAGSVCPVKGLTTGSRNWHLGSKRFADDEEVKRRNESGWDNSQTSVLRRFSHDHSYVMNFIRTWTYEALYASFFLLVFLVHETLVTY